LNVDAECNHWVCMVFRSIMWSPYWWLWPLLIVAALFKSAWFKDFIGKVTVRMAARLLLNKHYHLIKNVTIPAEDVTTWIDHILISRFGVFVVETRNMKTKRVASPLKTFLL